MVTQPLVKSQFDFDSEPETPLSEEERMLEELEAAVKETPPRPSISSTHGRTNSEPRALGDIIDENERLLPAGSPSLRHTKGRLETTRSPKAESIAAVLHEPTSPTTPSKTSHSRKSSSLGAGYPKIVTAGSNSTAHSPTTMKQEKSTHVSQDEKNDLRKKALVGQAVSADGATESYANVVKHEPADEKPGHIKDTISKQSLPTGDHVEKHTNSHQPRGDVKEKEQHTGAGTTSSVSQQTGENTAEQANGNAESYAEVVKHVPTSPSLQPKDIVLPVDDKSDKPEEDFADTATAVAEDDTLAGVGKDASPRTPHRKAHKRASSKSLHNASRALQEALKETETLPKRLSRDSIRQNGDTKSQPELQQTPQKRALQPEQEQAAQSTKQEAAPQNGESQSEQEQGSQEETTQPGKLVYENYQSRSGTNLASIQPESDYDLALAQEKNKDITSEGGDTVKPKSKDTRLVSGRHAGAGWARSAIRWAPLNVPLQRRLQTLAVLAHSLSIAGLLATFFFFCAIPLFWPVLLPYLIYVLLSKASSDGKLTHRSEWIRRSKFWSLFASYFPARLHRTVELEPTRKYILGYHPHGIISHGAIAAFATEALGFGQLFPGITNTLLTLDSNFRVPFYRDWALRLGLASVSRESCENLLSRGGPNGEGMGRAITIVIGGARESLDAKPGTLNLVLAKRKGFVKLAIRTGADLVPVLAFGENDMYEQITSDTHPWIHKCQMLVKKVMGFTVPLFHARGIFNYDVGIMPYRRPVNIVVGRPIRTIQSKKPDAEYVDKLHKEYTDQLLHIWDEWKDVFAPQRNCELAIVE